MKKTIEDPREITSGYNNYLTQCADSQNGQQESHLNPEDTGPTDIRKTDPYTSFGVSLYEQFIPAEVTKMQLAKYKRYGTNWTYLAAHLAMGLSMQELGILLRIELDGQNRQSIVSRLVGALGVRIRDEFRGEVARRHPSEPSK